MPNDTPDTTVTISHLDWGELKGGLVRMMERFREKGTLTDDFEADAYLRQDANAALLGLLYDQRVRAEYAFTGPIRLRDRLGHLDMRQVALKILQALAVLKNMLAVKRCDSISPSWCVGGRGRHVEIIERR